EAVLQAGIGDAEGNILGEGGDGVGVLPAARRVRQGVESVPGGQALQEHHLPLVALAHGSSQSSSPPAGRSPPIRGSATMTKISSASLHCRRSLPGLLAMALTLGIAAAPARTAGRQRGSHVTIDRDLALVIDGKKVFPIGFTMPPPPDGKTPEG